MGNCKLELTRSIKTFFKEVRIERKIPSSMKGEGIFHMLA
jgi:hypothetical protein